MLKCKIYNMLENLRVDIYNRKIITDKKLDSLEDIIKEEGCLTFTRNINILIESTCAAKGSLDAITQVENIIRDSFPIYFKTKKVIASLKEIRNKSTRDVTDLSVRIQAIERLIQTRSYKSLDKCNEQIETLTKKYYIELGRLSVYNTMIIYLGGV